MSAISESDILVIGAGLVGSSVAMQLGRLGAGASVRVIDFDLEGTLSSSELNAGGVRATWGQDLNIAMSKLSIEHMASIADEIGYRPCGYLWLYGEERLPFALKAREKQLKHGWPVEAWDVPELRRKVALIDKTEGLAGAVFAPRDGLVNSNLLKGYFRAKARASGVVFDDRVRMLGAERSPESARPWRVRAERYARPLSAEEKKELLSGRKADVPRETVEYHAGRVVNCAGAWAGEVATALGYATYSQAVRRQVCLFDCRGVDLNQYGMIVDSSGVYFHPEATNGLAGFANHEEPPGANFDYDGESFFMDIIWPALFERSSHFEALRHMTGWAGLYEVSPDESAILGPVPSRDAALRETCFEAHSFSGHGVMQSYAAGLVLAERIIGGRYETLDAAPFTGERFDTGAVLPERLVI